VKHYFPDVQKNELEEEKRKPLAVASNNLAIKKSDYEAACAAVTTALNKAGYDFLVG